MAIECRHGRLARKCELCEYEQEVAELRAELASVKAERDELRDDVDMLTKRATEARAANEMLVAENVEREKERDRAQSDLAAAEAVVEAARHLVKCYEKEGNGVGVRSAEDRLIREVKCFAAHDRAQPAEPAWNEVSGTLPAVPIAEILPPAEASPHGDTAECERAVARDPQAPATWTRCGPECRRKAGHVGEHFASLNGALAADRNDAHIERIARRVVKAACEKVPKHERWSSLDTLAAALSEEGTET